MNRLRIILAIIAAAVLSTGITAEAQKYKEKPQNRPYADMRQWHLGFSVGLHTQDLNFTNSGYVTPQKESWFVEQPAFQPGFCVNGLFDYRLSNYFNARFTPGLYFGSRDIKFRDYNSGKEENQALKSAFLVFPVDLKYSALRYRNMRPYLTAGVMPSVNLTRKSHDYLKLKPTDVYLTFGFGCDFYLPYFKFIPEIKFCFGLMDVVDHKRVDLIDDPATMNFTKSIKKATSQMVVLTFYFE